MSYQETISVAQQTGLTLEAFSSTILYTTLGIILLAISVMVFNKLFGLNIKKELLHDQNTAVGLVIAGLAISISVIIAGTIGS